MMRSVVCPIAVFAVVGLGAALEPKISVAVEGCCGAPAAPNAWRILK